MEQSGAASPGVLVLITGLSKPFRRLHKYSAMLQELERHMELSDPDRGDTQRGVAVYKDIDVSFRFQIKFIKNQYEFYFLICSQHVT